MTARRKSWRRLTAAGAEAQAFQGDLTRGADVKALVDAVTARFGAIDILVNNAGDLIERKPLMEMSEEFFHAVIDVNLTSAFLMCQAVGAGHDRAEARRDRQHVVARRVERRRPRRRRLLDGERRDRRRSPRRWPRSWRRTASASTASRPGLIGDTAFHGRFTAPAAFENAAKSVLLGRAGTPDEVATVVAFLASSDSSFLTGETIEINGGMNMR